MEETLPPPANQEATCTTAVYIRPFNALSTEIRIIDIKEDVPLQGDVYKASKKLSLRTRAPAYSLKQRGWWQPYNCYSGNVFDKNTDPPLVAEWKPSNYDMDSQLFTFPEGSLSSDHDITLRRVKMLNRHEWFVHNSDLYTWRFDNRFTRAKMTLFKKFVEGEKAVATFHGPLPVIRTCGALSIDENEVDILIAILTCCGVLRKDRQRH
jgi:hypothetical protein